MKFEMTNQPIKVFSFSGMTDIVMLLLIFFLLSSQFVISTGVKVKLPGAKNNEQTESSPLIVTITSNNKVFLGITEVGLESLAGELSLSNTKGTDANLVIRADKNANIETVIKVIDAAKGVQIDKFTIETEKESF